jgi:hypothetical protein
MPTLHVHLQDGFAGERATVVVNGRTAWEHPHLRTRPQLGLAEAVELEVPAGDVTVEVRLAGAARTHALVVDAERTPYLGVSLGPDGALRHTLSPTTFGYV